MAFAHGWALATMPLISVHGDDIIETPNSLLNVTRATHVSFIQSWKSIVTLPIFSRQRFYTTCNIVNCQDMVQFLGESRADWRLVIIIIIIVIIISL